MSLFRVSCVVLHYCLLFSTRPAFRVLIDFTSHGVCLCFMFHISFSIPVLCFRLGQPAHELRAERLREGQVHLLLSSLSSLSEVVIVIVIVIVIVVVVVVAVVVVEVVVVVVVGAPSGAAASSPP